MYVADVASAIVTALQDDGSSMGKLYELGGPDVYTIRELVTLNSIVSLIFCIVFFFCFLFKLNILSKFLIFMFCRLKLCMR